MRPLPRPTDAAYDTYLTCIDGVRSSIDWRMLAAHADRVRDCAEYFMAAARHANVHLLEEKVFRPQSDTDREILAKVYGSQMARQGRPGREVYDRLRAAADICPLCGVGRVTTLDHHLPKSIFLYLVVAPDNLIPACADCNKRKTSTVPARAEDQTLHPYFDDIDDATWLVGNVREEAPPSVEFSIVAPPHRSASLLARVEHHFELFDLARLYSINAAEEIAGLSDELAAVFDRAGADAVHEHLDMQAHSRRTSRRNCWQAATYRALANSTWYCSGGFRF